MIRWSIPREIPAREWAPGDNFNPAYAESADPWSIKNAVAVNSFPARFVLRIEEDFAWLDKAILQPDSAEGQELLNEGPDAEISYADAKAASALLVDPGLRRSIAEKLQKVFFCMRLDIFAVLRTTVGMPLLTKRIRPGHA